MSSLQVRDVWKSFGGHDVLRGVDLDVHPAQVVALIGASGSGKSTLLRCLNLLEQVDDGQVLLGDDDITAVGVDADRVRRRIGMVFQAYNLFPHLTVLGNLTIAARKVHGVRRTEAERRGRELLGEVGLADRADAYPDRLSGGQQQRVALARALMTRPEVVLLDEITSALDPELVGEVLAMIRRLADAGMTIVMATHEMEFCRGVADVVCFLDAGRIVESGPPAQVLVSPREERTRAFLRRVVAQTPPDA